MRFPLAAALALGLALPVPALAQAVIAPAAMPLPAVEAGPGWQPRSPDVLALDALRGARFDALAGSGGLARPQPFATQDGHTSGGSAY